MNVKIQVRVAPMLSASTRSDPTTANVTRVSVLKLLEAEFKSLKMWGEETSGVVLYWYKWAGVTCSNCLPVLP